MRLRTHFEDRAAALEGRATLEAVEQDGAVTMRLRPHASGAVGVVLYLLPDTVGTVALDDPACAPAELGGDLVADLRAIDHFVAVAVEGRATAFHLGRGGCVEEVTSAGSISRSWHNALPWPGWRRRAERVEYRPYA